MSAPAPVDPVARQAPYSTEAEQAVLGAMVTDGTGDAPLRAVEQLDDWMFYRESHRRLFRVMLTMARRGVPIEPITLKTELETKGELENVGGVDYLTYLLDVVPNAANFDYHARIIRDKAIQRRLIEAGTAIVQDAYDGRLPVPDMCESAEARVFAVTEHRIRAASSLEKVHRMVFEAVEEAEALHGRGGGMVTGLASGFRDLDERTAGFQPQDLVIVAARPSVGKTSLAINIAQHAAIEKGIGVAVFSLEMSKKGLVSRILTGEARVDAHRVRTGTMHNTDYKLMASAAGILSAAPIWIDDTAAITPLELRAKCRRHAAEHHNLGLVIVDYLQLMRDPEYGVNRTQEVGSIARSLKSLAKELNVPVMALSQLSRAGEKDGRGRRPQLSDLRESGEIEQAADTVLFIHRPELYAKDDIERDELRGQAEIIIGKQRNGPTGTVKLYFHGEYTRFDNYSGRTEERGEQQGLEMPALQRPTRTRSDLDD